MRLQGQVASLPSVDCAWQRESWTGTACTGLSGTDEYSDTISHNLDRCWEEIQGMERGRGANMLYRIPRCMSGAVVFIL